MQRHRALIMFSAIFVFAPALAEEMPPVNIEVGGRVELSQSDLDQITAHVLATHPIVSSSPGIKYAGAQRTVRSADIANVIYFPHAEIAGLKQALHVSCHRQLPTSSWACNAPKIRSYLQVEGQDFEVRVLEGIAADQALALIEATRPVALANPDEELVVPRTAILIMPVDDTIFVTWGSPEGYQKLTVEARLVEGGDPVDEDDWQASVYEYAE